MINDNNSQRSFEVGGRVIFDREARNFPIHGIAHLTNNRCLVFDMLLE